MPNYIFARICLFTILCSLLITGCLPPDGTAKAPTIPDEPYVSVYPEVGYPGISLDQNGSNFPPGETVILEFINPNMSSSAVPENQRLTYVTDKDGKFTHYYLID